MNDPLVLQLQRKKSGPGHDKMKLKTNKKNKKPQFTTTYARPTANPKFEPQAMDSSLSNTLVLSCGMNSLEQYAHQKPKKYFQKNLKKNY